MRDGHPFHMYDAILAQASAFSTVVADNEHEIKTLKKLIADSNRVFLVGTGTSYHAAWATQYILRSKVKDKRISAVQAIEFALYGENLSNTDLVIIFSHRGTKQYSLLALQRANQAEAKTALITGKNKDIDASTADLIVQTVEPEESSAHTISYTSALAVAVALIDGPVQDLAKLLSRTPEQESSIKQEVAKAKLSRKIWIVGSGPSAVTAKEAALKIKETSYIQTEGVDTEELIHGPFQSSEPADFFILVAPKGKAQERTLQLTKAIEAIGANYLVISGQSEVPEDYETISCIVPLQLFAYHLAIIKGTNPDNFRLEDHRFAKAAEFIKL